MAALALSLNNKSIVTLVVRSQFEEVKEKGFDIDSITYGRISNWKPHNVAKSVVEATQEFGPFDYIVLTTKNIPDGSMTCEEIIEPAVTNGKTTILLIQNGVGNEIPMTEKFPTNVILSGVSLINSTRTKLSVSNRLKDILHLAAFENQNLQKGLGNSERDKFKLLYQNDDISKNEVIIDNDALKKRWEKVVHSASINATAALVNLDINRCQINDANREIFEPVMDEIIAIAASEGITIGQEVKHKYLHISDGTFYSPSMMVDAQKNQLLELEVILGNPVRIAKKNNVEAPNLNLIYSLMKMMQFKVKEANGLSRVREELYRGNSFEYPSIFEKDNYSMN